MKRTNNNNSRNMALTAEQQQMVLDYMTYAQNISKKYYSCGQQMGLDPEDLDQEAYLGVCIAARKFDPATGAQFESVVYFWCRRMIQTALCHEGSSLTATLEENEDRMDDDDEALAEYLLKMSKELTLLSRREREVIVLVYGLEDDEPKDFKAVAQELSLSINYVRDVYKKAIGKLKEKIC